LESLEVISNETTVAYTLCSACHTPGREELRLLTAISTQNKILTFYVDSVYRTDSIA